MKNLLVVFYLFCTLTAGAQLADHIYQPSIHTVKLFRNGDQYSYPILNLHAGDRLDLHFDDFDADYKNFYYSFQLCNADWSVANLQPYDYIRGFLTTRITTYRNSSISLTRYTHYEASIPDRSSVPTRSGNYLLKVFRNNDTSDLYFTRRFLVVDNKVSVAGQVRQPFSSQLFLSDQRVQVVVNTANANINTLSPQDLKLVVIQNNSWPGAAFVDKPTIYRGNYYEYSDDATSFQAGREWRWIDLRSLRLMSDRMQRMVDTSNQVDVYVKPDAERKQQIYVYYRDLNGAYTVENNDGNNPFWQSDYSYTHFSFIPPGNQPYPGKDVYLYGELTNFTPNEASRMIFNKEKGVYERTLLLKQGYYNYSYVTVDVNARPGDRFSYTNTEGNFNNTENSYMILVYYRAFGGRADELIGFAQLNSLTNR